MHMEICGASHSLIKQCSRIATILMSTTQNENLTTLVKQKNAQTKTVIKAGDAGDQNPYELTPVAASVPVYLSNQLSGEERGMRGLCDTPCSPSIISVPFSTRTTQSYSHMVVCCHNHSHLSKNKPLGLIFGTGV